MSKQTDPHETSAAASTPTLAPDAVDMWLREAFAQADTSLPDEGFSNRVGLAIARRERQVRRRFVLAGAVAVAAALSLILGGDITGTIAATFEPLQSLGQAVLDTTQSWGTLTELAPNRADLPQLAVPKPGSVEGIASLVLLALAASWIATGAAE